MRLLKHNPETVVLLGMGPSLMDYMRDGLTQEFQPDFCDEIWSINMTSNIYFSDVVFWMDDLEDQQNFKPGLFEVMRNRQKKGWPYKVITTKAYPKIINSYDYPVVDCARISIPIFGKPYLNNGVAMAIAYAIHKKVKKLKIYGADFTYPDREYAESGRACVEAWVTLASVRGMEVAISPGTSLFDMISDHGVYGYKEQPTIEYVNEKKQKVKFVYHKEAGAIGRGVYAAEDTRNELRGSVPGDQGSGTVDAGGDAPNGEPATLSEAGAVEGSGESLRDQDRLGRDEAGHHASDVASRSVRGISDSGEASGMDAESDGGPGQSSEVAGPGDPDGHDPGRARVVSRGKAKAKRRSPKEGPRP